MQELYYYVRNGHVLDNQASNFVHVATGTHLVTLYRYTKLNIRYV